MRLVVELVDTPGGKSTVTGKAGNANLELVRVSPAVRVQVPHSLLGDDCSDTPSLAWQEYLSTLEPEFRELVTKWVSELPFVLRKIAYYYPPGSRFSFPGGDLFVVAYGLIEGVQDAVRV